MRYTYINKEQLNKRYIHDSEFEGYSYNYDKRCISFSCIDGFGENKINLMFNNVIYTEMQSCEFWYPGNNVYGMWIEENSEQMLKLLDVLEKNKEKYDANCLTEGVQYLEIGIQLLSGDVLFIICESLDWEEEKL